MKNKSKKKHYPRNYKKCIGCGNCINMEIPAGKCDNCNGQKWIDCTD